MKLDHVRYGVAGLGRAGWDIHIDQLRGRADAKVVAVVDSIKDRQDQAAAEFGCKVFNSFSKLLAQDDVEVVIIATPSAMHGPQAIQALNAGKHVVVEKPMAMNLAQADRMIAAARKAGRHLFVHQNYRFSPLATHLQSVVDSGILGKLYHIRAQVCSFTRRNDWQTLTRHGGGVLNNTAPHYIDLLLQLMGTAAAQVMGDLQRIASPGDAEDHVKALIRGQNGVTADLEISNAQNIASPIPRWILCGTHGTLTSDGKISTLRWFDPAQVSPLKVIDSAAPGRLYVNGDQIPWKETTMPAELPPSEHFYDNVRSVLRHDGQMRVTPQSVREVIRVTALIRKGTAFPGRVPSMNRKKAQNRKPANV